MHLIRDCFSTIFAALFLFFPFFRCFCFSSCIFLDLFVRAFAFCIVRCALSVRRVMYICCRCRLPSSRSLGVCVCRYTGYNQKAPTKFKCAIFYLNLIHWCSRSLYFSLYCPRQLFIAFHLDTQNRSYIRHIEYEIHLAKTTTTRQENIPCVGK